MAKTDFLTADMTRRQFMKISGKSLAGLTLHRLFCRVSSFKILKSKKKTRSRRKRQKARETWQI